MKKVISLIILSVLLILHISAQTKDNKIEEKPNFDGTWILEKIESPRYANIKDYENYLLVISFVNDQLKIKKSYTFKGESTSFELVLFTDKCGEKNTIPESKNKNVERGSKTYLKKNKIISEYADKIEINGKEHSFRGNEKYYLSKDGMELIFESAQTYPSFVALLGTDNSPYAERRTGFNSRKV